ncbi:MAG: hypothetical protein R3321_14460, partial [Nitrososphaeraceae archaeon]|nr:hypothetical protein [Nitrososphaeraceae archaeon]
IPAISSGIYGFPKDKCAHILVNESMNFLLNVNDHKSRSTIETVEFCIIDYHILKEFRSQFEKLLNRTS